MGKQIKDQDCKRSHSIHNHSCGCAYTEDEKEFMLAMEKHLRTNKIRFPTCTDCLLVIKQLGYVKHE